MCIISLQNPRLVCDIMVIIIGTWMIVKIEFCVAVSVMSFVTFHCHFS